MAELMRVLNAALAESHGRYRQLRHLVPLSGCYQAGLVRSLPTIPANNLLDATTVVAHFVLQSSPRRRHPPLGRHQVACLVATKSQLCCGFRSRNRPLAVAAFARSLGIPHLVATKFSVAGGRQNKTQARASKNDEMMLR